LNKIFEAPILRRK